MKVFNVTQNREVISSVEVLKTFSQKSKGLIGSSSPYTVFLKTRWGIHTFGLSFPIDVVVCDTRMKICVLRERLVSNRMFFWNPRYPNVFEFPSGTIRKSGTRIADILELR